jgi:hypothetical protein
MDNSTIQKCMLCFTEWAYLTTLPPLCLILNSSVAINLECIMEQRPAFFFSAEGSRSRRYGRTAAMRPIV